jgi:hypothetical protein
MASSICMSNKGLCDILLYHGGQHNRSTCGSNKFSIRALIDTWFESLQMYQSVEHSEGGCAHVLDTNPPKKTLCNASKWI